MIAVYIVFALLAVNGICALLYFKLGWFKKFFHDMLGWHQPDMSVDMKSDGLSLHCKCKYCGQDIMQDSQGNWY